ncbi:MAG: HAD family hydrolase [Clostridia bacterium]|nr:HAD family hydrolase [Clostridia bacterium]
MNKVAFLDRDGIINKKAPEHQYITRPEDFIFLDNVPRAIKLLNDNGYLVIIITNQRGIARGLMTMDDLTAVHHSMCERLKKSGAHIDNIYVCPHNNGECNCRKPDIGLFLKAESDYTIDKSQSFMIGDSESDIVAGQRYGIRSILTTDLYSTVLSLLDKSNR